MWVSIITLWCPKRKNFFLVTRNPLITTLYFLHRKYFHLNKNKASTLSGSQHDEGKWFGKQVQLELGSSFCKRKVDVRSGFYHIISSFLFLFSYSSFYNKSNAEWKKKFLHKWAKRKVTFVSLISFVLLRFTSCADNLPILFRSIFTYLLVF